jgi:hypothetical protein
MTSVDVGNGVSDDVLDVESARSALKPARAAALDNGMLAASVNLYPARHVRVPLRLEPVRRREDTLGSAIKAADEDLFAVSRYTPLGVSLGGSIFAYKQPSRLPVITRPG